jgi:hypothetical protein
VWPAATPAEDLVRVEAATKARRPQPRRSSSALGLMRRGGGGATTEAGDEVEVEQGRPASEKLRRSVPPLLPTTMWSLAAADPYPSLHPSLARRVTRATGQGQRSAQ